MIESSFTDLSSIYIIAIRLVISEISNSWKVNFKINQKQICSKPINQYLFSTCLSLQPLFLPTGSFYFIRISNAGYDVTVMDRVAWKNDIEDIIPSGVIIRQQKPTEVQNVHRLRY